MIASNGSLFYYLTLMSSSSPLIGIIMGSDSDLPTMDKAIAVCQRFEVPWEVAIVSAHRTPQRMVNYAQTAHERGLKVIIAGAGGGGTSSRNGGFFDPITCHRGSGCHSSPTRGRFSLFHCTDAQRYSCGYGSYW
ncbi:Phosphoribosylaminoimidazole carboxylase catalytic subunit [Crocosphaera watsonii WH 0005]|uniref:Phosphoribosylaminoimidazole carboxylase catalytic subunit n=1 Tax=Crocosphaera watsonii WH 0005 TaxID=423472 RepID=T2ISN7_CROWT|nr:Phosphoribosylaminoimidazole carboxylase catalytic subunit [Crocosphaera watsonii WH 0005]